MAKTNPLKAESLTGKYFHARDKDNEITWQGRVVGFENGFYILQLFEWLMGEPTMIKLMSPAEMKAWDFYAYPEAMAEAYRAYDRAKEHSDKVKAHNSFNAAS